MPVGLIRFHCGFGSLFCKQLVWVLCHVSSWCSSLDFLRTQEPNNTMVSLLEMITSADTASLSLWWLPRGPMGEEAHWEYASQRGCWRQRRLKNGTRSTVVARISFLPKRERISCLEKPGSCYSKSFLATLSPCKGKFTNCLKVWRGWSWLMPGQAIIHSPRGWMKPGICGRRPTGSANLQNNPEVGQATVNRSTNCITSSEQRWIS